MSWSCRAAAIRDAQVAWVNDSAREWTAQFQAQALWAPVLEFEDLAEGLNVDVVAILESGDDLVSRATKQQDYTTLMGFRQRYEPDGGANDAEIPNAWVDRLVAFVESVADKLVDVELNSSGFRVYCVKREVDLSYVGMALKEKRAFMAFLEVTWRELRAR